MTLRFKNFIDNKELGSLDSFSDLFNSSINKVTTNLTSNTFTKTLSSFENIEHFLDLLLSNIFESNKYGLARLQTELGRNNLSEKDIRLNSPRLFNKVKVACELWEKNTCFIINSFINDKEMISNRFFNNQELGSIKSISESKGDLHEKDLQTLVLSLSSGERICFKPRSLTLETGFFSFLASIGISDIYSPSFVDKKTYGWMDGIYPAYAMQKRHRCKKILLP